MTDSPAGGSAPKRTLKAAIVPVTEFEQNCTLLWDTSTMVGAVIDPGGDVPRILDAIKQVGVKVEKIVLTHGHLDHVGGAVELKKKLGVQIEGRLDYESFRLAEDEPCVLAAEEAVRAAGGLPTSRCCSRWRARPTRCGTSNTSPTATCRCLNRARHPAPRPVSSGPVARARFPSPRASY